MNTERDHEESSRLSKEDAIEKERQYAKSSGCSRIGIQEIKVRVPLTYEEKINSGEIIASNEMNIIKLNEQKKVFNDEIKAQVSDLREEITLLSMELDQGYRNEYQKLPTFYDHEANERIYLNMDTGEIVAREKARPEDRQLRMA